MRLLDAASSSIFSPRVCAGMPPGCGRRDGVGGVPRCPVRFTTSRCAFPWPASPWKVLEQVPELAYLVALARRSGDSGLMSAAWRSWSARRAAVMMGRRRRRNGRSSSPDRWRCASCRLWSGLVRRSPPGRLDARIADDGADDGRRDEAGTWHVRADLLRGIRPPSIDRPIRFSQVARCRPATPVQPVHPVQPVQPVQANHHISPCPIRARTSRRNHVQP